MSEQNEVWYGVKTVLMHGANHYEERVVLVKASSFEEAEVKGRNEIQEHLEALDDVSLVAIVDIYHLFDQETGENMETYSKITESNLDRNEYIKQRYEEWDGTVVYKP